jgi:hypothetical protein
LRPRTSSRTGLSPAAGLQAVHVGTLHGLKGLEYQRIILVGITDSAIPGARVEALQQSDPVRYRRELLRARSLLFVAATRARDSLVISWHGQPSRFLHPRDEGRSAKVIHGGYELTAPIASGVMGTLWEVLDQRLTSPTNNGIWPLAHHTETGQRPAGEPSAP